MARPRPTTTTRARTPRTIAVTPVITDWRRDAVVVRLTARVHAASSREGQAVLSLRGDLVNTQPVPEIVVGSGSAWNRITLSASTVDAQSDPVMHSWMIPEVGTWLGDSIEVELPVGRSAVILYADDVHRARGVAAQWVEIAPQGP